MPRVLHDIIPAEGAAATAAYGLIGYPLAHSFSASYFAEKFARESINATYTLYPIPEIDALDNLLDMHPALRGLNVTSPYKEQILPRLASMSAAAEEIGAVNVVSISSAGGVRLLRGYNSDSPGFQAAYGELLRGLPREAPALVLGTGGAAKAAAHALKALGFSVLFVSRKQATDRITYLNLTAAQIAAAPVIVQATPLGMLGHAAGAPSINYGAITPQHVCIDLIYNPPCTEFMERCAAQGARVIGGLPMLKAQAEIAWQIWTGEEA